MTLRPWMVLLFFALAVWLGVVVWNYQDRQLASARADAEAAQLALKGQIVDHEETAKALRATVADLAAHNTDLAAALAQAKAAAPDATLLSAERFSTGEVGVLETGSVPGRRTEPADRRSPEGAVVGPRVAPAGPSTANLPADAASSKPCALSPGDRASIEVEEITLQTKAGNVLVVGTATAYRESPLPRQALFGGKFQSNASSTSDLAPPAPPRWGVGLGGVCFIGGCDAGPIAALPPARLFGFQIEAGVGLLAGAHGFGGMWSAIGRW